MTRTWFVIGLAVAVVVVVIIGAAVAVGILTTGKGHTDECEGSPCQNGGTCEDLIDGIKCRCLPGYSGIFCQNDTDECQSSPCRNGGRCVDGIDRYACHCLPGYSGTSCQNDTDECQSSPCQNVGTCEDLSDGIKCRCLPGYSGIFCQNDTDECQSRPCQNGGRCVDRVNGFTCLCPPRYSGNGCQIENTGCDSEPCLGRSVCNALGQEHTCQCLPGYSGPSCQTGSQVAFSVYLTTTRGLATPWRRVEYRDTLTDLGGAYHNSTFYSPSAGVYYVALSADTATYVSYRLVGAPHSLGLTTTSTELVWRSQGRACVLEVPSQSEFHTDWRGDLSGGAGTSWSMFSLTAAFHPLVAFTVTRTTPTSDLGKINYPESLVNVGGGYRPADSHFVAPTNGTYYFSVSAGLAAGHRATLQLRKNDKRVIELLHTGTTHDGAEMISSGALTPLSRGDRVHVELVRGSLYSGPEFRETTFSGLLYSPVDGKSVAWSVWRTSSWTSNGTHLDPVPYDTVLVNDGDVYSTSQHVVTVPVSGVYCVHLVGGAQRRRLMQVYLRYGRSFSDGSTAAYINHLDLARKGRETTDSHSVLLTVEAGDLVWVRARGASLFGLYSNPGLVTGFSGFLVYPT